MALPERLIPFRHSKVKNEAIQESESPYEKPIPPLEGEARKRFEEQAKELLQKDLSPAVFNKYVDTMISILGTHEYSPRRGAHSDSILVAEKDEQYRFINFRRSPDGIREIATELHQPDGMAQRFNARFEKINLNEYCANEAINDNDYFAKAHNTF